MEVDKVGDMVANMVADNYKKKLADMELDMVADMAADIFKTKCIKPEMF